MKRVQHEICSWSPYDFVARVSRPLSWIQFGGTFVGSLFQDSLLEINGDTRPMFAACSIVAETKAPPRSLRLD